MPHDRLVPRPPAEHIQFARSLRQQDIEAERLLWFLLRGRRFLGYKFRRQHPVTPYVLDFYCAAAKLAVELDGSQHAENPGRDAHRDAFLASRNIRVLRFWNEQLFREQSNMLDSILIALQERTTLIRRFAAPSP